jgi:hypothetical protein
VAAAPAEPLTVGSDVGVVEAKRNPPPAARFSWADAVKKPAVPAPPKPQVGLYLCISRSLHKVGAQSSERGSWGLNYRPGILLPAR